MVAFLRNLLFLGYYWNMDNINILRRLERGVYEADSLTDEELG